MTRPPSTISIHRIDEYPEVPLHDTIFTISSMFYAYAGNVKVRFLMIVDFLEVSTELQTVGFYMNNAQEGFKTAFFILQYQGTGIALMINTNTQIKMQNQAPSDR